MKEKKQQIHNILSAYDSQVKGMKSAQNKKVNELKDRGKSVDPKGSTGTGAFAQAKQATEASKGAKFGLKFAPQRDNTGNFKNEPREQLFKRMEAAGNKIPPVGGYRPKFNYLEPNVRGKVGYGQKHQWEGLGFQQNARIKEA